MAQSFFQLYNLLSSSKLFDRQHYLASNRDVAKSGTDPVVHYIEFGAAEGRSPGPGFDVPFYAEQCTALGLVPENPLAHYLTEGHKLGLKIRREEVVEQPRNGKQALPKEWKVEKLVTSGLFDLAFYNQTYGFTWQDDREGLHHFVNQGAGEGKRPNFYFDPAWYLEQNPDVREAEVNPLFHYFIQGEKEGRRPGPLFDAQWYRDTYSLDADQGALAHYLAHRTEFKFNPIPDFDADYYGDQYKDVRDAGVDPFAHYVSWGYKEERNPSPNFNTRYYSRRYLRRVTDVHPFLHFLKHKNQPGVYGIPAPDEGTIPREIKTFTKPSRYYEDVRPLPLHIPRKAKVLAYHLTQFHPFAENDAWWGKGFTEWTNIARGVPRFKGHFQPRVPRDLGFYSLDDPETMRKQAAMAKAGGLYGFVYYYYWFNGKRLMEKPLERMLADPSVDMPFALMWANENWTRRWDGHENEVLISQDYDPRDDERMIREFVRHFRDKRYIRVNGRPLLMVYRPGIIPNCAAAVDKWRELFKKAGEEPILVMAQAFDDNDPGKFGLDGAIEFPPHKLTAGMDLVNGQIEYLDDEFAGKVFGYDSVTRRSLDEPPPAFPHIKTAVPSWDNDARRQGTGLTLIGSTPKKFEDWMAELVKRAQAKPFFGEAFVCINAWNEWCEAAYLEPDLHHGGAYLNAASRAITGLTARDRTRSKILLVGHDAFPSGAQHLLLHIGRELQRQSGVAVEYLLLDGGKMEPQYREVAPVWVEASAAALAQRIEALRARGFESAIVNTAVAARIIPDLKGAGFRTVALIHELPRLIADNKLEAGARAALEASDNVVFAADVVRDQVARAVGAKAGKNARIHPQGLYRKIDASHANRTATRKELGIRPNDKVVLGVGYADRRKGFDLFLKAWSAANSKRKDKVHFCWVGGMDPGLKRELADELQSAAKSGTFHLPGFRSDIDGFFAAADAYALTSREDPFPTVVHEALYAGLPVVAFDKAGGMSEFLKRTKLGTVVAHANVRALVEGLERSLSGGAVAPAAKLKRRKTVEDELSFETYVSELFKLALPETPRVSVAVPNYNYARYMPERLGSIFAQTHPVSEVILLDDCSKDDSLAIAERVAREANRPMRIVPNTVNSGSVFRQWRKAAEIATCEYLWIAEADDLSDPAFLDCVVEVMKDDPNIVMGFSDSSAIDTDGRPMWPSYKAYYAQIPGQELPESKTMSGAEFVRNHLAVRNLILNVSSVVWRREALVGALKRCEKELTGYRMAGDWRLYLDVLSRPGARIAYVADELNQHRRHATSVTHALNADKHVEEIRTCQTVATKLFKLGAADKVGQERYLSEVSAQLRGKAAEAGASSKSLILKKEK